MTWFKVDDRFHSHPKAAAASLAALGLWAVAGSWASDHTTDGDVPEHMILSLSRGATKLADELVSCGLWRRTRSGYRFHQWSADGDGTRRNPMRKEVEEERRKKAEAGRKGGLASGKTRSRPKARASPPASGLVEPPTRPDPTVVPSERHTPPSAPPSSANGSPADGRRGTRLPEDFTITDAMKAWAREHAPLAGRPDHDAFMDHWRAQSGQRGVKRDWEATWRNWMRRVQDNRTQHTRPRPASRSTTDERMTQAVEAGRRLQAVHDAQHPRAVGQ